MTNSQLAARLLTAPRRFFDDLTDSPRFALPMWLILLVTAGLVIWFYSVADIQQIIEQQVANNPKMTDAQRDAAARFMTRGTLTWISAGSVVVVLMLFRLLETLYYWLAGKFTGHRRSFRQWFAFAWWTATPGLLGALPTVIVLLFSPSAQLDPGAIQPLSLNSLFFHLKPGESGYQTLQNVSIVMLLSLALTLFGMKCWSKRSWLYSGLVTLLPAVLLAIMVFAGMHAAPR